MTRKRSRGRRSVAGFLQTADSARWMEKPGQTTHENVQEKAPAEIRASPSQARALSPSARQSREHGSHVQEIWINGRRKDHLKLLSQQSQGLASLSASQRGLLCIRFPV